MVKDTENIQVDGWDFDEDVEAHMNRHNVNSSDIVAAWASGPLYFRNLPGRGGTHVMIGKDDQGRVLYVSMFETPTAGIWRVVSAWQSRLATRIWLTQKGS